MEKKNENQMFIIQVMLVVFLALLIAYPVTIFVRNANNPSDFITDKQLAAMEAKNLEIRRVPVDAAAPIATDGSGISVGQQSTRYTNTGSAIITVNINNITRLAPEDFTRVGQTPWSLMNTVRLNMSSTQVLDIVFNNDNVVNGFFSRPEAVSLIKDSAKVAGMISGQDPAVEKFLTNQTVQDVLNNDTVFATLSKSKLITNILLAPTAQYFIRNPAYTKKLIASNPSVKAVFANEKVRNMLLAHPYTKTSAKILYQ